MDRRSGGFRCHSLAARTLLGLLLAGLGCVLPLASADLEPWGRPVVRVELDSDGGIPITDFARQIAQKPGEPLDRSKVADSLRNLWLTGRFRDLRVDYQEEKAGVVLIFVAKATFFAGTVRVMGAPKTVGADVLKSAARLRLGQPLSEEDLAAARLRMQATLAENAYYQAAITSQMLKLNDQEADVLFMVVPGPAARLTGVDFVGHPLVPARRLEAVAGWRRGIHLSSARLDRGLSRLHKYYVKHKRLEATLSIQTRTPDTRKKAEKLVVEVEAGPTVNVAVRGARIGRSKLRRLLPVFSEGQTDDLSLADGERKLEDYFQRQGYYSAAVKWGRVTSADGQNLNITYTVERGARGNFVGMAFQGNAHAPEEDLVGLAELTPQDFPRVRGVFSQDLLAHDVQAFTAHYQSLGYLDAKVTPQVDDHYHNLPHALFVTFKIEEGPRTTVGKQSLQGVDDSTAKKLKALLLTNPGQPYSPERARTDQDAILTYLADQGHNHATVTWSATPPSPDHKVDVEYRIEPGPREQIQRVVLMGNKHTRHGLIDRQLTFHENEPLRESDMLSSQRRLYDLGVFNQVQIAHQDPETGGEERTVLVSVEEARRWTLGYGFGFDEQRLENSQPVGQYKASPRFSLEVTRLNVGGRAQTLSLRGRYSDLEKGGAANYLIPHIFGRPKLNLRFTGLDEETRDVLTFTAVRQEGDVILERHSSPSTFLLARYSYRRVRVIGSTLRLQPEAIPLFSQPENVAALGATYVNDHRDNPADATRGSYSLADASVSSSLLGSHSKSTSNNFLRLLGQNSTYYRLGSHLIFARNTRLGLESSFGAPTVFTTTDQNGEPKVVRTHEIPLPERFFMGGSESHRGFSLNGAGPRDPFTGFPIGGNALFLNALELRVPLEENKYGLVLFHDAGNVYSSLRRMRLLKFSQSSPTDFDYAAHAVGLGLRYNTPVGPLRIDVGYALNPPRFLVQPVQPATGPVEVHRLSNFQFFLSVGQSF
jgi:outer membrane protein insertion porin family